MFLHMYYLLAPETEMDRKFLYKNQWKNSITIQPPNLLHCNQHLSKYDNHKAISSERRQKIGINSIETNLRALDATTAYAVMIMAAQNTLHVDSPPAMVFLLPDIRQKC